MLNRRRWLYLDYWNHSKILPTRSTSTWMIWSQGLAVIGCPFSPKWEAGGQVLFRANLSLLARQVIAFKCAWWLSCIFTKKHENLWELEECASVHSRRPIEPEMPTVSTWLRKRSRSKTSWNTIIWRRKSQLMRPLISLLSELLRRGSELQTEPESDVAAAPTTIHSRETTLGLMVALNNREITVEPAWKK